MDSIMSDTNIPEEDEISLIDLMSVLLRYKIMIISVTVVGMIVVLILSVISLVLPPEKSFLPNIYTPQAQMLIQNTESSSSSINSMLNSSGLGGLASLAGFNVSGGSSNSSLVAYLVHSNTVLDATIQKFNLVERYKIKKFVVADTREALKENLLTNFDEDSGVFTISFSDIDPEFARNVVNFVVDLVEKRFDELGIDRNQITRNNLEQNIQSSYDEILRLQNKVSELEQSVAYVYSAADVPEIMTETAMLKLEISAQEQIYAQLKAQYELLKIEDESEQPVFQILEYAEVPDKKSKPSRGMLCIIVTFASFFVAVFMAFLLNAIKNVRNDPVAMKKLKGTRKR